MKPVRPGACRREHGRQPEHRIGNQPASGLEGPSRRHRRQVGEPQVLHEAGQPEQQAEVRRDRGRHGSRRRLGGCLSRRVGLPREGLHLPRQPAPGAQHRGPGRHQRCEELPERRRLGPPALLRHRQGRRLQVPRGQRPPPRRGVGQHHRPSHRPGSAVRPRLRGPPGQPFVRRRPGLAHLLRPGPDRPAAPHRRLLGTHAPGGGRHRRAAHPCGAARRGPQGRPGLWDRHPRPVVRRGDPPLGPRRRAGHRGLRQRLLPVHQRDDVQRHRRLAGPQEGRLLRQPLLHADPPDLHPGQRRLPVEADAHVRVAPQRRTHLGTQRHGRRQGRGRHPRVGPRLLPGAQVPGLRKPGPTGRGLPERQDGLRRGARHRPAQERRVPGLPGGHRPGRRRGHLGQVREPVRHVPPDHR